MRRVLILAALLAALLAGPVMAPAPVHVLAGNHWQLPTR